MISELLARGKENAIPARELAAVLNCDIRTVAELVQKERREGKPICAMCRGRSGYYLAANQDELDGYCKGLFKRAGELHKTRRALVKVLDTLPKATTT